MVLNHRRVLPITLP